MKYFMAVLANISIQLRTLIDDDDIVFSFSEKAAATASERRITLT